MKPKDNLKVVALDEHNEAMEQVLGEVKALHEQIENEREATGLKLSERADDLEKHSKSLEDLTERIETIRRDTAEAKRMASASASSGELMGEVKQLRDSAYLAGTNDSEADYRKVEAGSLVQLRHLIEGALLPTGEIFTPRNAAIIELQKLNDAAVIIDAVMRTSDPDGYRSRGGIASLGAVKQMRAMAGSLFKADADLVDTTDLTNFVPVHFSSNLYELVKIGLPEIAAFPEITMPGKSYELPVSLTDVSADYIAEKTTIATASPFADTTANALNDAKVTLSAKKLRARVLHSMEADEDSIVPLVPFIQRTIVRALQEGLADAIINGDESGDLDDTASSATHFGRACPATGTDPRVIFDGLRSFSEDGAVTEVDAGNVSLSSSLIAQLRAAMAEFGVDESRLALFTSTKGYLGMLDDSNFLTADKAGDRATLITGQLGSVYNIPLFVSRRYPTNLADGGNKIAAAAAATSTHRTGAILVNRDSCVLGNRRRVTLGADRYGATDTADLYAFWRGDFEDLFGTSYAFIAGMYDVALS